MTQDGWGGVRGEIAAFLRWEAAAAAGFLLPPMWALAFRWLVVFKRVFCLYDWADITQEVYVPKSTMKLWVARYERDGTVKKVKTKPQGRPRRLSGANEQTLIRRVLDNPRATLSDHQAQLTLDTGKVVSLSALGAALHRHGIRGRMRVRRARESRSDVV